MSNSFCWLSKGPKREGSTFRRKLLAFYPGTMHLRFSERSPSADDRGKEVSALERELSRNDWRQRALQLRRCRPDFALVFLADHNKPEPTRAACPFGATGPGCVELYEGTSTFREFPKPRNESGTSAARRQQTSLGQEANLPLVRLRSCG